MTNEAYLFYGIGAAAAALALPALKLRLELSRAKHPSLSGHSRMARRFAGLVPFYEYDDATFFDADAAPAEVAAARRGAFMRLAQLLSSRAQQTAAATAALAVQSITTVCGT